MAELKQHVLICYKKANGAVDKMLEGISPATLKLWALQNTTSSKASLIFERDTGKVIYHVIGKRNSMPEVQQEDLGSITDYEISIIEEGD